MQLPSEKLLSLVYPVGSIYMSASNVNPSNLFGGTWEQIKDKFLLAAGNTYSAGTTGGESTHKLTTNEIPKITGDFVMSSNLIINTSDGRYLESASGVFKSSNTTGSVCNVCPESITTKSITDKVSLEVGGGQAHNNMPPYLAVYIWKRTA